MPAGNRSGGAERDGSSAEPSTERCGEPAVVLSPAAFNELADRAELPEILAMISRSEADLEAGCATDARKSLQQLAEENDLKLD